MFKDCVERRKVIRGDRQGIVNGIYKKQDCKVTRKPIKKEVPIRLEWLTLINTTLKSTEMGTEMCSLDLSHGDYW